MTESTLMRERRLERAARLARGSALAATLVLSALALSKAAQAQVLGGPQAGAPANSGPGAALPTPFDVKPILDDLKLTARSPLTREDDFYEMDAVTADGRTVSVTFDLLGRISEIEDEDYAPVRGRMPNAGWQEVALDAVRKAGFADPRLAESNRNHAVIRAANGKSELVELYVSPEGMIYKQVWLR